jgi:hypothetical protein
VKTRQLSGDEQHKRDIEMIVEIAKGFGIEVQASQSLTLTMTAILTKALDR